MVKSPWVLISGSFNRNGGMDKANLELAEYLLSQDIPIHLVTHSAEHSLSSSPNVQLHEVPRPFGSFALGRPLLDLRGRITARMVTAQYSDATILVNGANCAWPGINWAHYVHSAWRPRTEGASLFNGAKHAITHQIERGREHTAYRRASLIVANSNLTRRHLIEHLRISPDLIKTVYLGSDPSWLPPTPQERLAARQEFTVSDRRLIASFVGAVSHDKRKGLDTVLGAWKHLCADPLWDVDLFIAGSGRALPEWQSKIREWGLDNRIKTLGFYKDVRKLLIASDLLISPARYEAYGLNVQEAICCGLPAIVSASAGIAERYPENLGMFLLSNPEDADLLSDRVRLWRADVERWKKLFIPFGSALRSNSWTDVARNIVSLATEFRRSLPTSASPSAGLP